MPHTNPESRAVEAAVTAFEAAWQTGARPAIEDFVPAGPGARTAAVEMIHIDLEYRLKGGEAARVEEYLARFTATADPAVRRELVRTEHRFRARREPGLRRADYAPRFPEDWQHLPPDPAHAQSAGTRPTAAGGPALPGLTVLHVLGEGGMGVVYLARDEGLNREVAVKTLRAGLHATGEQRGRFQTEAEVIARLPHDGIVRVLSAGESDGVPYFVMEYLSGGTLAARLAGAPQPPAQAARWVAELAGAVGAAHAAGVVHRDLKPANVLLDPAGRLKVADFGLAQLADGSAAATQTGAVLGTPSYMAPEQAAGRTKDVGPAADVYALGAILYECLTGRPPFRAESREDTLLQVLFADPIAPRRFAPSVPRDLETICLKCLEKDPARRYRSAEAAADDLRRFLAGRPIAARAAGPAERVWRWCRRNPAPAALAALVAVAVGGVVGGALAFARQAQRHANDLEAEGRRVKAALAEAREEKATAERERARAEALLAQASESAAARQAILDEFVVEEVLPGLQHGADPDRVREKLADLTARAGARFEGFPVVHFTALNFLSSAYYNLAAGTGRPDDAATAADLCATALTLCRNRLGRDHPTTLTSVNNYWVYRAALPPDRGDPAAVRCAELNRNWRDCCRALGPDHTLALTARSNWAIAAGLAGDAATAERELRAAVAAFERVEGAEYPQTLGTRVYLALALSATGREPDARRLLLDYDESHRRRFGRFHPQTVNNHRLLALWALGRDDPAAALPHAREALAGFDRYHPAVLATTRADVLVMLGAALLKTGDPAGAEKPLRDAGDLRRRAFGPTSWRAAEADVLLGAALAGQGRHEAAEPLLLGGYERVRADATAADVVRNNWVWAESALRVWGRPGAHAAFLKRFPQPK